MPLCSIVKVDIAGRSEDEVAAATESPRVQGALLVATSVADHAAFSGLDGKGFTYFQGECFGKPRLFRHRGVARPGSARCASSPS